MSKDIIITLLGSSVNYKKTLIILYQIIKIFLMFMLFCSLAYADTITNNKQSQTVLQYISPRVVHMRAVGDIQLDRGVTKCWQRTSLSSMLAGVRPHLLSPDITFGNLESLAAHSGIPSNKKYLFRAHPNVILALKDLGFDVLSLANNHIYDYGREAIFETIDHLNKHGIKPVGYDRRDKHSSQAAIAISNGLRVAFLAYSQFPDKQKNIYAPSFYKRIAADIVNTKKQAEFVVVSFHWGIEYEKEPTKAQRDLAKHVAQSGADLIVGHHPHIFQGIEVINQTVVAYSLGNFIFDQSAIYTTDGLILDWQIDENRLQQIKIYPVKINIGSNARNDCNVSVVIGSVAQKILNRVQQLSNILGTTTVIQDSVLKVEINNKPENRRALINKT